jgi:uncharacterized protein YjiK
MMILPRMIFICLLALIFSACGAAMATPTPAVGDAADSENSTGTLGIFPHPYLAQFEKLELEEPSGIIFHPGRGTLFVIGDKGHLSELRPDGIRLKQEQLGKKDTEDITYNPISGNLYIAVEGAESILEVDPEEFRVIREISVERSFKGQVLLAPSGNGLEGIAFVPDESHEGGGTFFLANQSDNPEEPSLILEVEISNPPDPPVGKIINYFSVQVSDLSGLYYDQPRDRLLVISDDNNVLLHLNRTGEVLDSYALYGEHQEGITLDAEGFLYIAEDADELVNKFKWNEMR